VVGGQLAARRAGRKWPPPTITAPARGLAFGRTADQASLDVVKAIGTVRTGGGDRPVEPVVIKKATVKRIPKQ
jgi:peptidyl-prolyl cis-trans isomerase A (cyclophilin A)